MLHSPLDFPAFLTHITSVKSQISSQQELAGAFSSLDHSDSGYIDFEEVKRDLMTTGSKRMSEDQVSAALGGFVERTGRNKGKIAYGRFLEAVYGERT
jgi:Ca2+-binding EF-hand superfamily protein